MSRFNQLDDMNGHLIDGNARQSKTFTTLYLDDLSDFIVACVINFGFSRYAERLGM
jgi:hypothetical protein